MPLFTMRWLALLALLSAAQAAHPAASPRGSAASAKLGAHAEVLGFWRFERDVQSEAHTVLGSAVRREGGVYFFSDEVPGPFTYDPIQRLSYPNSSSLSFQSDAQHNEALEVAINTATTNLSGQSVTLELFAKPNAEWSGPLAMKSRLNDAASEWGLEARLFEPGHQTFLQAFFTAPGASPEHLGGEPSLAIARVRGDSLVWHHLAFVYDAPSKTVTYYVDYCAVRSTTLSSEMKWDAGALFVGGAPGRTAFGGKMDEVRLSRGTLRPSQFLRARKNPVAGLSFESVESFLPRDSGYVDLKESFGAVGDGKTDDTAAVLAAFRILSDQPAPGHQTLYIPPGTYLVTAPLQSGSSLSIFGAGVDKTVIKLRDSCAGFTRTSDAQPLWRLGDVEARASSEITGNRDFAGIALRHLSIDTGKGNSGAKGLEVQSGLLERLEDLQIRSGDGAGLVGLDLAPKSGGAGFLKNLRVKGFDYGIIANGAETTCTLEQITLEGQRLGGLKNTGGILTLHQLTSVNAVTAVLSLGGGSMDTLLDCTLKGGAKEGTAVHSEGGLCVLRLETTGYKTAIRKRELLDDKTMEWKDSIIPGPKVAEYVGDRVVKGCGDVRTMLKLPIENTPEVPWGDIHKDWVNVRKFTSSCADGDWRPAIQAAVDSGAKTIYFPPGTYEVRGSVRLHGKIDRLLGLQSSITRRGGLSSEDPVIIFDEPNARRVTVIECLQLDGVRDNSPATLILKCTCSGHYDNAEKCGKLFMENMAGADFQFSQPQSVWVRQWNNQGHGIFSHGATIWCLGLRAGAETGVMSMEGGARTEIFGGLLRTVENMTPSRPFFSNANSQLSVAYATPAGDPPHELQIVEFHAGDTNTVHAASLKWTSEHGRMDLFRSDASIPAPAR